MATVVVGQCVAAVVVALPAVQFQNVLVLADHVTRAGGVARVRRAVRVIVSEGVSFSDNCMFVCVYDSSTQDII